MHSVRDCASLSHAAMSSEHLHPHSPSHIYIQIPPSPTLTHDKRPLLLKGAISVGVITPIMRLNGLTADRPANQRRTHSRAMSRIMTRPAPPRCAHDSTAYQPVSSGEPLNERYVGYCSVSGDARRRHDGIIVSDRRARSNYASSYRLMVPRSDVQLRNAARGKVILFHNTVSREDCVTRHHITLCHQTAYKAASLECTILYQSATANTDPPRAAASAL